MSCKHEARGNGMGRMHKGRETFPVIRPAFHILIMGTCHILETPQLTFFIQLFHIEKFPLKNGGFHEHIIFFRGLPCKNDLF